MLATVLLSELMKFVMIGYKETENLFSHNFLSIHANSCKAVVMIISICFEISDSSHFDSTNFFARIQVFNRS